MGTIFEQVRQMVGTQAKMKRDASKLPTKTAKAGLKQKPIGMRVKNAVKNFLTGESKITVDDLIKMQMTDSKGTFDQANKIIKNLIKTGK